MNSNPIEVSMNEKQLAITLTGPITTATVKGLIREIDYGFDYYHYPVITVRLDSPGGEHLAMRTLLDTLALRRRARRPIHVHATQLCASAAALILAHGGWGTRTVEPNTHLQFHWSRAMFEAGLVLTRDMATSLVKGLTMADQKTLENLVASMCAGAGGQKALVDSMSFRFGELLDNWEAVAMALDRDVEKPQPVRLVAWVKELQRHIKRWSDEQSPKKQTTTIVEFLKARFEKDTVMDLRQAYVLCLIDVIKGVLPTPRVVPVQQFVPVNLLPLPTLHHINDLQHLTPDPPSDCRTSGDFDKSADAVAMSSGAKAQRDQVRNT